MTGGRGHPSTVPGATLAAVIRRRHDALRENVEPARDGQVEGVHQARVASRRLREVVPVLGDGLDEIRLKPLKRRLRDVTRALGPVRELDVALDMLDEVRFEGAQAERLRQVWRDAIEARREAPLRTLRDALAPQERAPLERQLDAFETARGASLDAQWRAALAARLATRAHELRDRIERTGSLFHPEALHEVRIAGKKLRYALEITADAGLARLARPLRTLKNAQDVLGRLHDLDVLVGLLQALPEAAPGEALQGAAADVEAALDHESRWLHARYLRSRASVVRLADATLDTVVPRVLTRTVARRRGRDTAHAR